MKYCDKCENYKEQISELWEERRDLHKQVQEYARCIDIHQNQIDRLKSEKQDNIVVIPKSLYDRILGYTGEITLSEFHAIEFYTPYGRYQIISKPDEEYFKS